MRERSGHQGWVRPPDVSRKDPPSGCKYSAMPRLPSPERFYSVEFLGFELRLGLRHNILLGTDSHTSAGFAARQASYLAGLAAADSTGTDLASRQVASGSYFVMLLATATVSFPRSF